MQILVRTMKERIDQYYGVDKFPADWKFTWAEYEQDEAKIAALCPDAEVCILDSAERFSPTLMDRLPKLRLIHAEGVGFDGVDCSETAKRGIFLCNNAGANAAAVAEHTVLLMLACLRRLPLGDSLVRSGRQGETKARWSMEGLRELSAMEVGIIGLGAIGQQVARRLAAFGCLIRYFDIPRRPEALEQQLGVTYAPLEELLAKSDLVTIHIASNAETFHFMDEKRFSAMKRGSIFVNTARGELVDNDALRSALLSGQLFMTGIDCLAPEPVQTDNPMLNLPESEQWRTIFSPHIAGVTYDSILRVQQMMWENIAHYQKTGRPDRIVNGL